MNLPSEERLRFGEVMEGVEEEDRLDVRVQRQPRRVGHRERHVREMQAGSVGPRALDGGSAVIVPGKVDVRQAVRQLARDLAGSAPDVGGDGDTAKPSRGEIGEAADGHIPRIGRRERVVRLGREQSVVELPVQGRRGARRPPSCAAKPTCNQSGSRPTCHS